MATSPEATLPTSTPTPTPTPTPLNSSSTYLQDAEEVKKVFNRFDVNGDGKISVTELVDVMKALGSDTSEDEVKRIMDDLDTDRDGFINLDEFAKFCDGGGVAGEGGDDGGLQELKDAFELYDEDKNGLISAGELHHILNRLGEKCSVEDCTGMIQSVDTDGDGCVNFGEFRTMMTNNKSTAKGSD